jgi:hypothetical protein
MNGLLSVLIAAALLLGGAYEIMGKDRVMALIASLRTKFPNANARHLIGAAMVGLALVLLMSSGSQEAPTPAPTPPDGPINLTGLWTPGEFTAQDIASVEALFDEVAADVEWDASKNDPDITTGIAFDELRTRAFDMRLKGDSIGDRHPKARAEIKRYLDSAAGVSGGPLTPEVRDRWIKAFKTVATEAGRHVR